MKDQQNCFVKPPRSGATFLMQFFVEIIVDSPEIVRNNIETSLVSFTQFSPMVTFYKIKVNITTRILEIDTINHSYSDFPFYLHSFVFMSVFI